MKFLAFSDLHLSNALPHAKPASTGDGLTDRLVDQKRVLGRIRKKAIEHGVDAILALGDVFDKSRNDAITAAEGLGAVVKLTKDGTPLYLLRGNHECVRRDGGRNFLEAMKAFEGTTRGLVTYMDDGDSSQWDLDGGGLVSFSALGFCDQKTARASLKAMKPVHKDGVTNILLLHHSIMGCTAEGGWVCDDGLGADEVTDDWDWVFSGHFHPSQTFGRDDRGMYLGSTMQLDYGDKGRACGFWLVEVDGDGNCTRTFIDSGAPRFFEGEEEGDIGFKDDGDGPAWTKGARPGDYVRRIFRATRDDWRAGLRKRAIEWKEVHAKIGYRADYQFQPISRSKASRIFVGEEVSSKKLSPYELAERYLNSDTIEKGSLSKKDLKRCSRVILDAVGDVAGGAAVIPAAVAGISSITIKDFGAIGEAKVKLKKAGLVWVSGINNDTDSSKSNGSAKTTLFRALTWGLFGETTDEKDRDEVIRRGEKLASVQVRLTDGTMIERTRKKGSEKLNIEHKGFAVEIPPEGAQKAINELIGMNFNLWRNTILYAQDDGKRFLRSKDARRKEIMYDLLGLDLYKLAYEAAKTLRATHRKTAEAVEQRLSRLSAAGAEIDLTELDNDVQEWELARNARVEELVEEAKLALERAKEERKKADATDETEAAEARLKWTRVAQALVHQQRALVKAREGAAEDEAVAARADRARAHTEHRLKQEALAGLGDTERCPVCNSKLAAGDAAKHVLELKKSIEALATKLRRAENYEEAKEAAHNACRSELKLMDLRRDNIAKRVAAAEAAVERARAERARAEEVDGYADAAREEARRATAKARAARDEENPHAKRYEAAVARAREIVAQAEELKVDLEAAQIAQAQANFWMDGFGTQGIPSWLLDETMPELTKRANDYLLKLADGDITIEFESQRELKSDKGEFKDEIAVKWVIENQADVLPSGGQWRKMELATDLALMDIASDRAGVAPNLLILDEALDGIDEVGRSRVVSLLAELRAKRESIFVISHSVGMSELFERELVVEKSDGVATVSEAA